MGYASSEEAMEANETLTVERAARELGRHYCRVLETDEADGRRRIKVTNDVDVPEWIDCTTRGVLEWLGY